MSIQEKRQTVGYLVIREDEATQLALTKLEEHLLAFQDDLARLREQVNQLDRESQTLDLNPLEEKIELLASSVQETNATLHNKLAEVNSQLTHLQAAFSALAKEFQERDHLVEMIFKEREELKAAWVYEEYLKPAAIKLIELRSTLLKARSEISGNASHLLEVIDHALIKVLNSWAIEERWDSPDRFDPGFQRAVVVPSSVPEDEGLVLDVLDPAYYRHGNLIREQVVAVAQYQSFQSKEGLNV